MLRNLIPFALLALVACSSGDGDSAPLYSPGPLQGAWVGTWRSMQYPTESGAIRADIRHDDSTNELEAVVQVQGSQLVTVFDVHGSYFEPDNQHRFPRASLVDTGGTDILILVDVLNHQPHFASTPALVLEGDYTLSPSVNIRDWGTVSLRRP